MFTAQEVKELRSQTNCGMMECKRALEEANGDMERARVYLREKGLLVARKKMSRLALDGMVFAVSSELFGVLLEVNSETDFVARNDTFRQFVRGIADQIIEKKPNNIEELLEQKFLHDNGKTVADVLNEQVMIMGENLVIRRFVRYEGLCVSYIHGDGRIASLIEFDVEDNSVACKPEFIEFGKMAAMHISASNPGYLSREDVPSDVIELEEGIIKANALSEGKPEAIVDKVVAGRLEKYYKEECLLNQDFVVDPSTSFGSRMQEVGQKLGVKIAVARFCRYEKGEGLQMESKDNE